MTSHSSTALILEKTLQESKSPYRINDSVDRYRWTVLAAGRNMSILITAVKQGVEGRWTKDNLSLDDATSFMTKVRNARPESALDKLIQSNLSFELIEDRKSTQSRD
jgi:hypothetical protein